MSVTFRLEGLDETVRNLGDLPKATGRNVLRRTLKKAAEPIAAMASRLAPRETGYLASHIFVSFTLTGRHRSEVRATKSYAEVYIGTAARLGVPREFGTRLAPATPFLRPAWDALKDQALMTIQRELGREIEAAASRLARKAARAGA